MTVANDVIGAVKHSLCQLFFLPEFKFVHISILIPRTHFSKSTFNSAFLILVPLTEVYFLHPSRPQLGGFFFYAYTFWNVYIALCTPYFSWISYKTVMCGFLRHCGCLLIPRLVSILCRIDCWIQWHPFPPCYSPILLPLPILLGFAPIISVWCGYCECHLEWARRTTCCISIFLHVVSLSFY